MGLGRTALPAIESVTVENENIVQVKSMAPAASYLQKYIKINVLSSNLFIFFWSTGQRKSSNGASSAHVPECKAVSSKQLQCLWASSYTHWASYQYNIYETTYPYTWVDLRWLLQLPSFGRWKDSIINIS